MLRLICGQAATARVPAYQSDRLKGMLDIGIPCACEQSVCHVSDDAPLECLTTITCGARALWRVLPVLHEHNGMQCSTHQEGPAQGEGEQSAAGSGASFAFQSPLAHQAPSLHIPPPYLHLPTHLPHQSLRERGRSVTDKQDCLSVSLVINGLGHHQDRHLGEFVDAPSLLSRVRGPYIIDV